MKLQWKAAKNPFIQDYEIVRHLGSQADFGTGKASRHTLTHKTDQPVLEFVDTQVEEEERYTYRVEVRYQNGNGLASELFTVTVLPVIKATVLLPNYPNPFNPETWIPYELEEKAQVHIELYDVRGELVRTLDLGVQPRGRYTSRQKATHWDGRNQLGERAASGV